MHRKHQEVLLSRRQCGRNLGHPLRRVHTMDGYAFDTLEDYEDYESVSDVIRPESEV
jgi:hypothetical protein